MLKLTSKQNGVLVASQLLGDLNRTVTDTKGKIDNGMTVRAQPNGAPQFVATPKDATPDVAAEDIQAALEEAGALDVINQVAALIASVGEKKAAAVAKKK